MVAVPVAVAWQMCVVLLTAKAVATMLVTVKAAIGAGQR